jgi:hypothetical protein
MTGDNKDASLSGIRLGGTTEANQSVRFSSSEDADLEAAREACFTLKRSFSAWLTVGKGIGILRQRADRLGGRKTFARLMAEQGFRMDGPKAERQFTKSTATRLLQVMERKHEVVEWHQRLPPVQQIAWASPDAIIRHCPVFAKPKEGEPKPSPFAQLREANIGLQEQLHRARQEIKRGGGDLWNKDDRPEDIANIMLSKLSRAKAERVARAMLAALKAAKGKAAADESLQRENSR